MEWRRIKSFLVIKIHTLNFLALIIFSVALQISAYVTVSSARLDLRHRQRTLICPTFH